MFKQGIFFFDHEQDHGVLNKGGLVLIKVAWSYIMLTAQCMCLLTWERDKGHQEHYGKKNSQRRQCDARSNFLLENLCECNFDTYFEF